MRTTTAIIVTLALALTACDTDASLGAVDAYTDTPTDTADGDACGAYAPPGSYMLRGPICHPDTDTGPQQ